MLDKQRDKSGNFLFGFCSFCIIYHLLAFFTFFLWLYIWIEQQLNSFFFGLFLNIFGWLISLWEKKLEGHSIQLRWKHRNVKFRGEKKHLEQFKIHYIFFWWIFMHFFFLFKHKITLRKWNATQILNSNSIERLRRTEAFDRIP